VIKESLVSLQCACTHPVHCLQLCLPHGQVVLDAVLVVVHLDDAVEGDRLPVAVGEVQVEQAGRDGVGLLEHLSLLGDELLRRMGGGR